MAETLTEQTTVVVTSKQVSSNLAGEEVILHLESGVYYGLDEVGATIWAQVQQPKAISAICQAVCDEFEVAPEQCRADTLQFLQGLLDAQLIEVVHAGHTEADAAAR